jgi:deoxyribose-phosphate aldolase
LSDELIARAAQTGAESGADFIKTATGTQGSTKPEHVRLVHETLHGRAKVKASGGIRTAHDARIMIEAGADRIGTSSAVAIAEEWAQLYGRAEQVP